LLTKKEFYGAFGLPRERLELGVTYLSLLDLSKHLTSLYWVSMWRYFENLERVSLYLSTRKSQLGFVHVGA